jgi:hypothetical protein
MTCSNRRGRDMIEKRGVIEEGRTPPEDTSKEATEHLEEHATKRAADAAKTTTQGAADSFRAKRNEPA